MSQWWHFDLATSLIHNNLLKKMQKKHLCHKMSPRMPSPWSILSVELERSGEWNRSQAFEMHRIYIYIYTYDIQWYHSILYYSKLIYILQYNMLWKCITLFMYIYIYILYCVMLYYYIKLYHIILYYIILSKIILHYAIFYYITLDR